jgi:hypothetical protein
MGSKIKILNEFCINLKLRHLEDEFYLIIVSGYEKKVSIENIFDTIIRNLKKKVKHNSIDEKLNFIQQYFSNLDFYDKEDVNEKIILIEDLYSDILDDNKTEKNKILYICVHSLDDLISDNESLYNNYLSKLSSIKNIHLFGKQIFKKGSVDHINSQICKQLLN